MKKIKTILPVIAGGACLAEALFLPDSSAHPAAEKPYFSIILLVILILTAFLFLITFFSKKFEDKYSEKAPFYTGILVFLGILNILTVKTAVLPVLYFPSLDRIFGVLVEDFAFIGKCLLYSLRLQLSGWFFGAAAGILTGIAIGFKR